MMLKKTYILLIGLLLSVGAMAQPDLTRQAYEAFQNKEFLDAADLIDKSIASEEGKDDAQTWHIRGFIYKDIYKEVDQNDRNSEARDVAVESFSRSMELDANSEFLQPNEQSIKFLATTMYNDCVVTLNIASYEESEKLYEKHKEVLRIVQPDLDTRTKDIEYYNALASIFDQQYDKDHNNKEFLWKTLEVYERVLSLDSNDYGANYNTGILYYNEGVEIIKDFNPLMPIDSLLIWQDSTSALFRKAEPFMHKAYLLNENRVETVIGLSGIYYSLGEDSLSAHYKEIKEKLDTNPALTPEENEAYLDELNELLQEWIQVVLQHYPGLTEEKYDDVLGQLKTSLEETIKQKRDGGATIYFRDKFDYKQEVKQGLINELNLLVSE